MPENKLDKILGSLLSAEMRALLTEMRVSLKEAEALKRQMKQKLVSIKRARVVRGDLVLDFTDGISQNIGRIVAKDGEDGKDGNFITDAKVIDGELCIYTNDGKKIRAGYVAGDHGEDYTLSDDDILEIAVLAEDRLRPHVDRALEADNLAAIINNGKAKIDAKNIKGLVSQAQMDVKFQGVEQMIRTAVHRAAIRITDENGDIVGTSHNLKFSGADVTREGDNILVTINGGAGGGVSAEGAVDAVAAALAAGSHNNITITYNDAGDAIDIDLNDDLHMGQGNFIGAVNGSDELEYGIQFNTSGLGGLSFFSHSFGHSPEFAWIDPHDDSVLMTLIKGTGLTVTGNIAVSGTVDGRDLAADGAKVDFLTVTQAVDLDQMETDIAALANGMVYKGDWDASSGSFPSGADTGAFYYVTVAGTVDGVSFAVGDNIVATTDSASTSTYAGNWSKHDQTDAVQAVAGLTGSISAAALRTALNVEDGADTQGAASSTDNALARFDGTTGKIIQNSSVILDDNGRLRLGGAGGSGMIDIIGATDSVQGLRIQGDAADAISFSTFVAADSFLRFSFLADGTMSWGSGAAVADTNLYRDAANKLKTDDSFEVGTDLTVLGDTTLDLITYDAARGKVTAGGNLGSTETINFNDETNYTGNLDSNITFTFANATSGDEITLYLTYSGAQRTITWPTMTWLDNNDGSAPTAPAASGDVLVVTVRYIGTTYYASATGNYAVYS